MLHGVEVVGGPIITIITGRGADRAGEEKGIKIVGEKKYSVKEKPGVTPLSTHSVFPM